MTKWVMQWLKLSTYEVTGAEFNTFFQIVLHHAPLICIKCLYFNFMQMGSQHKTPSPSKHCIAQLFAQTMNMIFTYTPEQEVVIMGLYLTCSAALYTRISESAPTLQVCTDIRVEVQQLCFRALYVIKWEECIIWIHKKCGTVMHNMNQLAS